MNIVCFLFCKVHPPPPPRLSAYKQSPFRCNLYFSLSRVSIILKENCGGRWLYFSPPPCCKREMYRKTYPASPPPLDLLQTLSYTAASVGGRSIHSSGEVQLRARIHALPLEESFSATCYGYLPPELNIKARGGLRNLKRKDFLQIWCRDSYFSFFFFFMQKGKRCYCERCVALCLAVFFSPCVF